MRIFLFSIWWAEEGFRHYILQVGIPQATSEEAAYIVGYQEKVTDELAFVEVEIHVILHVCLAVGKEQEVSIICTLLTPDPHNPNEHRVEIGNEHEIQVQDPQYHVCELNDGGDKRSFQRDLLQRGKRDYRTEVVGKC